MDKLGSPQWRGFGWALQPYDAYGDKTGEKHSHAEGEDGFGIESPTGRDYGAVVSGKPGAWRLSHVAEYSGISDIANQISDALDFMGTTGSQKVSFEHDEHRPGLESTDLVNNLYQKRPNFPKEFPTVNRAQFVAETLIKRRDANIPLTPRPRRKSK